MISGKIRTPSFQETARLNVIVLFQQKKGAALALCVLYSLQYYLKLFINEPYVISLRLGPPSIVGIIDSSVITSRVFGQRSLVEKERTLYC